MKHSDKVEREAEKVCMLLLARAQPLLLFKHFLEKYCGVTSITLRHFLSDVPFPVSFRLYFCLTRITKSSAYL